MICPPKQNIKMPLGLMMIRMIPAVVQVVGIERATLHVDRIMLRQRTVSALPSQSATAHPAEARTEEDLELAALPSSGSISFGGCLPSFVSEGSRRFRPSSSASTAKLAAQAL